MRIRNLEKGKEDMYSDEWKSRGKGEAKVLQGLTKKKKNKIKKILLNYLLSNNYIS